MYEKTENFPGKNVQLWEKISKPALWNRRVQNYL